MIDDRSDKLKLDYYVDDEIKLSSLTSFTHGVAGWVKLRAAHTSGKQNDATIDIAGSTNVNGEKQKSKSVKLTSLYHDDVKRVLVLVRKVRLAALVADLDEFIGYLRSGQAPSRPVVDLTNGLVDKLLAGWKNVIRR